VILSHQDIHVSEVVLRLATEAIPFGGDIGAQGKCRILKWMASPEEFLRHPVTSSSFTSRIPMPLG
jgi:hypothetical protein